MFTDCESCTRADFHKPGIYGSGRVWANAWDVFRRAPLEVVAVAGLLWISWCVLGGAIFFVFFSVLFFFERTRPAASMRPPCLINLCTSVSMLLTFTSRVICSTYATALEKLGVIKDYAGFFCARHKRNPITWRTKPCFTYENVSPSVSDMFDV